MPSLYLKESEYAPAILAASKKYGVPAPLILGHIRQESNFNPKAYREEPQINDASYGMMQLLLKTAKGMDSSATPAKLYDPNYNIDLGTRLIASNLQKYGSMSDAIAAYNAGVPRKNEKGEYVNSKGAPNVDYYVKQVTKYMNEYIDWIKGGTKKVELRWWDIVWPMLIIGIGIYWYLNRDEGESYDEETEGDYA